MEGVDFMSDDTSRAAKVPLRRPNTARLYENFATAEGEVMTFKDTLRRVICCRGLLRLLNGC